MLTVAQETESPTERGGVFKVLGVGVDAIGIPEVIVRMEEWIRARQRSRFIAVTGMHGVAESRLDPAFRRVLAEADLVVPDGMPLVWIGRLRGHQLNRRVYGPELMLRFCEATSRRGYRHFFYGGAPGVPESLTGVLSERWPGLVVAGTLSPPFRTLTEAERLDVAETINEAHADVVWVGLGTPKQERFMWEIRAAIQVPVLVGVGAAFDLHTGRISQAPVWLREHGFEWLWRLAHEPRRLWRRYLIQGPRFAFEVALELARLKRFD